MPVDTSKVIETAEFLLNMFRNEFIPIKHQIQTGTGVLDMLEKAEKMKMLKQIDGGYTMTDDKIGNQKIEFCKN